MAEYIEYRTSVRDHYKITRLAKLLDCHYAEALGNISLIWTWAAHHENTNGCLKKLNQEEIIAIAKYEGKKKPEEFIKALVDTALIDPDMTIHDWGEYGISALIDARERKRKSRIKKSQPRREEVNSEGQRRLSDLTRKVLHG